MAKSSGGKTGIGTSSRPVPVKKKTSVSGNRSMVKMSSMNKSKKRSHKAYKGQGR